MDRKPIVTAGRVVGSLSVLAEILGVTKGAISQWRQAPADRAIHIAKATGWRVTPHELRPDLYPNQRDGIPPDVDVEKVAEMDCTTLSDGVVMSRKGS